MQTKIRGDKAKEFFLEGYNCAQAVVLAFCDKINMSEKAAARIVAAFGGGMGRLREVCGTVSAMFFVLSYLHGYDDPNDTDAKKLLYARVQDLANRFREKQKTIICRKLLVNAGIADDGSHIPEKRSTEYYEKRPCPELVKCAADILEEYLDGLKNES